MKKNRNNRKSNKKKNNKIEKGRKNTKKGVQRGGGISEDYYLVKVNKIIGNILIPYGIHDDIKHFDDYHKLLKLRKATYKKTLMPNEYYNLGYQNYRYERRYGIYFAFFKKEEVLRRMKSNNDYNFNLENLMIFDVNDFFKYILEKHNKYKFDIPLVYFCNDENYGINNVVDYNGRTDIFLKNIIKYDLSESMHELVCRIPIPLTSKTGLIYHKESSVNKM